MTDEIFWPTRRQFVGGAAAMVALAAGRVAARADAPARPDETTAQGVVFEDADGSGVRGPDSKGIPGVMVSNGGDVVLTDADGSYLLPVAPGDSLFVIKPTDWMVPVAPGTLLPRFAYVYTPTGTPAELNFRFHGLPPSGPLPDSVDFALRRQEESPRFGAVLFADPQPESLAEIDFIRDDMVARLIGEKAAFGEQAAFGITLGDVMFDDLSFYDRYNRIVGAIGTPWFNLPGNHDINFEAPDNANSRDTFKRIFGARDYAFQYGGTTFLMLDNVEYLGTDPTKPNGAGKYRGFFNARQLGFVRNVLANVPPEDLVVACFHIPLRTAAGTGPAFAAENADELLAAISTHVTATTFAGHTHTNEHYRLATSNGAGEFLHHHHVLAAVSGSWWSGPFDERGIPVALQADGCPNGCHILVVEETGCSTNLVPAREPRGGQIRLVLDSQVHAGAREVMNEFRPGALLGGPIPAAALGSTRLVANFFDAGENSVVEVAFGADASFQPMVLTQRTDPFVEEVFARNAETKKPWVQPVPCTHLWQLPLPEALGAGAHRISVRGRDEFGREFRAAMVLEVTG